VITIGEPFYLPEVGHTLKKEQLNELTDIIMNRIAALLSLEYQGEYTAKKNEDQKS
jgi:hypothetical protein